ncbi:MAG: GTPase, partial [Pseudomonadota bacterium]
LLAEIGIVGLPNAGKSTLIAKVSAARPKIADYPFSTLIPTLGVVSAPDGHSFVMADLPGLVKGAHDGAGLGHRFLRHIERTKVLLFLLDDRHHLAGESGHPIQDLEILQNELLAHNPSLLSRPNLIALNKTDLLPQQRQEQLLNDFAATNKELLLISAATGTGVKSLVQTAFKLLQQQ